MTHSVHETVTFVTDDRSKIYRMKCQCKLSYIGQSGSILNLRYNEYVRYIKSNNSQSAYANHILSNIHEYGPIEITMTQSTRKGKCQNITTFNSSKIIMCL